MPTTRIRTADDYVQAYGASWALGVLTEHLARFLAAGGRVIDAASGRHGWAVLPDGRAYPLVCGDLVEIPTEDGPLVGRCGSWAVPIDTEDGPLYLGCEGHNQERESWMNASELERLQWERRQDEVAR